MCTAVSSYWSPRALHARANFTSTSRFIVSIITDVTYGKTVTSLDDDFVIRAKKVMECVSKASIPGVYAVEYLPILRYLPSWFPGATAQKLADHYLPYIMDARNIPFAEVKDAVVCLVLARGGSLLTYCLAGKALCSPFGYGYASGRNPGKVCRYGRTF